MIKNKFKKLFSELQKFKTQTIFLSVSTRSKDSIKIENVGNK